MPKKSESEKNESRANREFVKNWKKSVDGEPVSDKLKTENIQAEHDKRQGK